MVRSPAALALAAALAAFGTALAEPAPRDRLILLFKVMASSEECEFPIEKQEAKAVSDAATTLVEELGLKEAEADKVFDDTRGRMDREGWAALCDPNGPWAATWRETVKALGPR